MTAASDSVPAWFRRALFTACVSGACWGGAIAYWRLAGGVPSNRALGLMLAGLPAFLLLASWTLQKRAPQAANAIATSAALPAAPPAPVSAPAAPLAILAGALRVPHASSAAALGAALAQHRARAGLDPELVDDGGFPLMTARCPDAEDDVARAEFAAWLTRADALDPAFGDEQWRALVLAGAVVADLVADGVAALAGKPFPLLELAPLLPASWPPAQRQAARAWLVYKAVRAGWPTGQVRASADEAARPSFLIERLAREADATGDPALVLALACDSAIGADTIARWADAGVLFSASHAHGVIPGEGAAGLLLAALSHVQAWDGRAPVLLDVPEEDRQAQAARRCDPPLLASLAERLLRRAGVNAAAVGLLVADTGHRTRPAMELMGYAAIGLPRLDAAHGVLRVGLACGSCGAVPFMAALVLAWHEALQRQGPVLCVGNEEAAGCCVALVRQGER